MVISHHVHFDGSSAKRRSEEPIMQDDNPPPPALPPSPALPPPPAQLPARDYVNNALKERVESLEQQSTILQHNNIELERRCDKILEFLVNILISYIMMMGAISMTVVLAASMAQMFYTLMLIVVMFMSGFGVSAYVAYKDIHKMQGNMSEIRTTRNDMAGVASALLEELRRTPRIPFSPLESMLSFFAAEDRASEVKNTLQFESEAFKEDHVKYIAVTCAVATVYLLLILCWTVSVGSDNLMMSRAPQYMPT